MTADLPEEAGRVTVLGDGGWGTALAVTLQRKGVTVTLWGAFPEYVEEMRRSRVNRKFLAGIDLPEALTLETDAEKAARGAELVVVAIPTKYMRATLERIAPALPRDVPYVSVAKGLEEGRLLRGTEIVSDCLGPVGIGCLSGPSHAEEVAKRLPTAVVAAAEAEPLASLVQATFLTATFRVYRCTDLVGVELGGAVKNVIAIAAGICDGLGFGDNSKAALLTRGLAEMTRLGVRMGAEAATFRGLSGIGDLVTTCYSPYGRNRAVGVKLGQGVPLEEIEASTEMVAEGVRTAPAICDLAGRMGIDMPIAREVCAVLFNGKAPKQAVVDLMTRPPRAEDESFERGGE
ncbi:MAG: NAD(P)H-dependent glycerol-3-phosphate dehydrogenase [Planctomycetota bacterium]|jgi:glycerol-3-phosphate dehydrogenase (NAD(P)+)